MSTGAGAPAPRISVVAAVIERQGRYLLALRPRDKRHGGLWEFPGGKLHDGETLFAAARRELAEELSVEVAAFGRTMYSAHDEGSPFIIDFVEVQVSGEPVAVEHDEIGWFTPAEMRRLPLAPADARFAARVEGER